jgi:hypothetical protein
MDAKAGTIDRRYRVDEVLDQAHPCRADSEVVALDPVLAQPQSLHVQTRQLSHAVGIQAGGIHHPAARVRPALPATGRHVHAPTSRIRGKTGHGSTGQHLGSPLGRQGTVGTRRPLGVKDAGAGREESGHGSHPGLQTRQLGRVDQPQILDAVGLSQGQQPFQLRLLGRLDGDDELARLLVVHTGLGAELLEQATAPHAEAGLESARGIVHAAMGHLAVTRGDPAGEAGLLLQQDRLQAAAGAFGSGGAAYDAASHDRHVDLDHPSASPSVGGSSASRKVLKSICS